MSRICIIGIVLHMVLSHVSSFQAISISKTTISTSNRYNNKHRPFVRNTKNKLRVATTKEEKVTTRNVFHDYNKPLVLIGCSSKVGDELSRLAKALVANKNCENTCKVIQLAAKKEDTFLQSIETDKLGWPNVLILDVGDSLEEEGAEAEDYYKNLAKSLYEDNGLLSVYVNVDSTELTEECAQRKQRMEKDIFVKYSDYEICIRKEGSEPNDWEQIEWEFYRLLARARLIPAIPGDKKRSVNTAHLTMGLNTFFLSLSFPEITQVEPYVEDMCKDVDAMEYRTDLLDCRDNRFDILYGMQLLRKYCRPYAVRAPALPFGNTIIEDVMPIVYTVRTANQAGKYPDDDEGISSMFELLEWGLRGGAEIVDVESAWDFLKTNSFLNKAEERYSSQILGSHHIVGKEIEIEDAVNLFQQCALNGRAHGAKVVLSIDSEAKDRMAYEAALITTELADIDGEPVIPNIGLILGDVGQFSRVINLPFTPVTHESLPFKAAPGQLTASEIMTTRLLTGLFARKKFCILGHNIAYSVSPQMQGAAFSATRLPHEYGRWDVATVEEFVESEFFKSDEFGGASVTIPHKQAIIPYVDILTEAAETIGSVNTLSITDEFVGDGFKRIVHGDNTDWKGIYGPLERRLLGNVNGESDYALILGAGGTARAAAYAAKMLGLKLIYYNRTPANAVLLQEAFGGTVVDTIEQASSEGIALGDFLGKDSNASLRVVISTLPASSKFILPDWLLNPDFKNLIVFDVNYKPYYTELLRQAESSDLSIVRGSEMLWEQGVGQFEIWTERTAPYSVMKSIVLKNCQE